MNTYDTEKNFIYGYTEKVLAAASLIMALTNLFWLVADMLPLDYTLGSPFACIVVLAMAVFSSVMFFLTAPRLLHKDRTFTFSLKSGKYIGLHMAQLFLFLISIETTVIAVQKNILYTEAGTKSTGIMLSSLYLFIFIFLPSKNIKNLIADCLMIAVSVTAPAFLSGHEAYGIVATALMGVSIITACVIYRNIFLESLKNTIQANDNQRRYQCLLDESIAVIAKTIDSKNSYLDKHSQNVAQYAVMIANELGYKDKDLENIRIAALLHDIGKMSVPNTILDKTTKLTNNEWTVVKEHTIVGSNILKNVTSLSMLCEVSRWHHEHYDGSGYPDGLRADAIPQAARIVCIADALDAMTSQRSYNTMRTAEDAAEEILRCKGSQFDPAIAELTAAMICRGDFSQYIN